MSNRWIFYYAALQGDFSGWDTGSAPYPGFYRFRYSRRGIWGPCALWDQANGQVAAAEGVPSPSNTFVERFDEISADAGTLWDRWCWASPVTEDQYRHAIQHGHWWDTLKGAANDRRAGQVVTDVSQAEPIGPALGRR